MNIFLLITNHFWLLALVVTAINAAFYRQRIATLAADHPERVEGYRRFLVGYVAVNAVVWLVMGFGVVVGGVPGAFAYLNPATGGPFVLLWHVTVVAVWIVGIVWLFFRGGAQFFIDHPGLLTFTPTRPWHMQLFYLACLAGGVAAEVMMWSGFLKGP